MSRPELERVRALCLALPDVEERLSHGSPAFFTKQKQFVHYWDDHHGDGRHCIWCAAPIGMQEALTTAEPNRFFRPPYVGHRGWIGVNLDDDPDWSEIEHILGYAHRTVSLARAGRG
ncbi:MAG TPA: MmcQ/YjbR family DNA-binding protein [Candidatus Dormibacteraeota bacterium]